MNNSLSDNFSPFFPLLGIFITSNFDFLMLILIITSYATLGLVLVLLYFYFEEWGKDHHIALSNLARLTKLSLKTTFTKPAFPLTETNGWLLSMRLALGSNLFLWIVTLSILQHPVSDFASWYWSWQAINALLTIIVWIMRPMTPAGLYPYGCFKDLQKILIFGILTTSASLIATNTNVNAGGLLAQQTTRIFQFLNSWNIWANPIATISAFLMLYLCTITFNTLRPRRRQFELNYAYSFAQKEPGLAATLELLRGLWQLNMVTLFVIVFLGGNRGLLYYPTQDFPSYINLGRFVLKILIVGLVIHIWRQKQVELTTKQWLHFFLKRFLPVTASVLWLTCLFN